MSKRASRQNACHILLDADGATRVLVFQRTRDGVQAAGDVAIAGGAAVPGKLGGRDWQLLFQPRLDVAWMSASDVCLRVVDLPGGDPGKDHRQFSGRLQRP